LQRVYITLRGDDRIAIYNFDPADGALTHQEDIYVPGGPSPFAVSPNGEHAYAGLREQFKLASFKIDSRTGSLTTTGTADLNSDPCHISVDNTGRYLLSAYYAAGQIAVHPINDDGAIGSVEIERINTRHRAHCAITDDTNQFVFLPHVDDSNAIFQYKFDAKNGSLTPNTPPIIEPPPGNGPRHYAYHPNNKFVYFDNEQGCSVTAYRLDPDKGTLSPFQNISTLPENWSGENSCAQIHMTSSGNFLYATNRGHDSVAIFAVSSTTGMLKPLGQHQTLHTPRAFAIDPTDHFMLVGGLDDGLLATYRIEQSGQLTHLCTQPVGNQPMWIEMTGYFV